jgi:hypothetical protein
LAFDYTRVEHQAGQKKISSFRMPLILNPPVRDENLGRNLFCGGAAAGIHDPGQDSESEQHHHTDTDPSGRHVEQRRAHDQSYEENHKPDNVQRK